MARQLEVVAWITLDDDADAESTVVYRDFHDLAEQFGINVRVHVRQHPSDPPAEQQAARED